MNKCKVFAIRYDDGNLLTLTVYFGTTKQQSFV